MTKAKPAAKAADPQAGRHWADPPLPVVAPDGAAAVLHFQICADPTNPRKDFDPAGLDELEASIVRDGLVEPLVLRELKDVARPDGLRAYRLIAGERRWRAIGQAIRHKKWPEGQPIACMVKDVDETTARRLALDENLQRRDLNPVEEARALQALADLDGISAAQIGRDLGFTERWAQQRLSLLKLPEKMQDQVGAKTLKVEDARLAVTLLPKLPPIKRVELESGKITVALAKAWLDEQPAPLSDAARLAFAEFLEKAHVAGFKPNDWTSQPGAEIFAETIRTDRGDNGVSIKIKVDPVFDELVKRRCVESAMPVKIEGVETGRHYALRAYYFDAELKAQIADLLNDAKRPTLIGELRVKLLGREAALDVVGRYATDWLNCPPPGPLPAEIEAEIAQKREAREARDAAVTADRAATDAARAAEHNRRLARRDMVAERGPQLIAAEALAPAAGELAQAADLPLPWWLDEQLHMIIAANGEAVTERPWNHGVDLITGLRLVVALANAAGGVATPAKRPRQLDPDAPAREAFVTMIVGELLEAEDEVAGDKLHTVASATAAAEAGLAAFLRAEAIDFADDAYDWGEAGANALANGILDEGLGEQVDLEGAVAAAPDTDQSAGGLAELIADPTPAADEDDETPEYLRRLACGGAGPAAEVAA